MSNNRKHYAAVIVAFTIWGFFSLPLRALADYTPGQILYFRLMIAVLVLGSIVLLFKRGQLKQDWQQLQQASATKRREVLLLTFVGGALLTINWLVFIYVVNKINVKTASFSYLICPVITAVLGSLLLKEKMSMQQWIAVGLCALSCVLVGLGSVSEIGFSFFTALTYALYLISQRRNQGFDRIIILFIQVLFSFTILSCFVGMFVSEIPTEGKFYFIIAIIAVLFTVVPLFLNLFALNRLTSTTIGIFMYINPLLNFFIALVFFDETMSTVQIVGYSIIFCALILFNAAAINGYRERKATRLM